MLFKRHFLRALALLGLISVGAFLVLGSLSPKAKADDWSYGVYAELQDGYVLKDFGVMSTTNPVVQGGTWVSYKGLTFDLWSSVELDGGTYGARGGDEIDFTVKYNDTADSPIGVLNYEVLASYYAISFPALDESADDVIEFHVEFERPFKTSWGAVKPYVRVIQLVALETMPDITFVRPGIRLDLPLDDEFTLKAEGAVALNLTQDKQVAFSVLGLHYKVGDGLALKAEVEMADGNTDPVISIGFSKTW